MRSLPLILLLAACGGTSKPAPAAPISNQAKPEPAPAAESETIQNAGILGSYSCGGEGYGGAAYGCGGAFASLTGTGDISSGFDDSSISGGLVGSDGSNPCAGGANPCATGTATGTGGGGTGWGTIGTGRYGTIGHGSGTGSGYGTTGGGSGGMRGNKSAAVPQVRIGQPSATAGLDKAIIRRYIKRNIQKIQYCYERELLADAKLEGKVTTKFTIGADGKVTTSTASGVHADVAACVAKVIELIEFPKPKGGAVIDVVYPFTFKPTGG